MSSPNSQLEDVLKKIREDLEQHKAAGTLGNLDDLTVKELKLIASAQTSKLNVNDQKASIVSVVVLVAVV
jgi:hypothetical protein